MSNLMHNAGKRAAGLAVLAALWSGSVAGTVSASPKAVKGTRSTIDGMPVLRVWGQPHDRGYALGYHFGREIVTLIDEYVAHAASGGPEQYERMVAFSRTRMSVDANYRAELRGMMEGIRAKLGSDPSLASLGRDLRYDDLVTFNSLPELSMLGCSSFAVWGDGTADKGTLAGRNLDWYAIEPLIGSEILVVQAPSEDGSRLGWVSVTWPSFIGCLTGMNAEGVTVSMHDVAVGPPQGDGGFVPRGFALRDAIESAHASTAFDDVSAVLRARHCAVGNNIPVNRPSRAGTVPAAVFEYDGNVQRTGGVTERRAKRVNYMLCTNHYVARASPRACHRYEKIDAHLAELAQLGKPVAVEQAWDILHDVAFRRTSGGGSNVTLYSVVFEPDAMRMHVALAGKNRSVMDATPVTIDIAELFRELQADGPSRRP